MERSTKSVTGKRLTSCSRDTERNVSGANEESGWTAYFDDLYSSYNYSEYMSLSLGKHQCRSSSLLSDAASVVGNKTPKKLDSAPENVKRQNFKKRRTAKSLVDDEGIEDTASSLHRNNDDTASSININSSMVRNDICRFPRFYFH
ncbi:unnamed protein product [Linum trigynum]|uniref:Uncharacterized protein n=1 Tax=Linum trigynum TaxID=586398 RepID=A0AAV2CZP1_9ROSI